MLNALNSVIAGAVGGLFVIWGVNVQFRKQSEAACRALLVEIRANNRALKEMVNVPTGSAWERGAANPGWLKRSVWESQLPLLVRLLDDAVVEHIVRAYGLLELVPQMVHVNSVRGLEYSRGGWIDTRIQQMHQEFETAEGALNPVIAAFNKRFSVRVIRSISERVRGIWSSLRSLPSRLTRNV